jgi:hypothetical protein
MGEQREASMQRWLEINRSRVPEDELADLVKAAKRRHKRLVLSRALAHRQNNRPLAALNMYARVVFESTFTPSSLEIVSSGLRSMLGAAAESIRLRKHPVWGDRC